MTPTEFIAIITAQAQPIILLEGTRNISEETTPSLAAFAAKLALAIPNALFRSGNAAGADDAFASGIISVDPKRLQYILPTKGSRKKFRSLSATALSLEELPAARIDQIADETVAASPEYTSMMKNRHSSRRLANLAAYLLRDTLKIVGYGDKFSPATFGIFYVNPDKPTGGGTGHTIRVCKRHNIPIATQDDWMTWDLQKPLKENADIERIQRIVEKCVRIFARRLENGRGGANKFVYKYLERLLPGEPALNGAIYEDHVIPLVRERHFKGMTADDFLEKALTIYHGSRFGGLELVWDWLDNDIPFTSDEYTDFVEILETALGNESNPPTKEDWEELNDWLMK
nr:hypothetical protein [Desulfobulbaceae bacterium]